jgi:protein O-mannosyl-transferase
MELEIFCTFVRQQFNFKIAMAKQKSPTPNIPSKSRTEKVAPPTRNPINLESSPSWFGLVLALIGFFLYVNTYGHLYALDDYSCLKDNYIVQGGLKNLGTIFSTEYRYGYKAWGSIGSLYRPATLSMFALEWQLSPDNPKLYHLMNAFFYGLSGWLLWATWKRILVGYPAAMTAVAILIFMVHPVHTEAVANIKSRDEIMALLCCTGALYLLWRYVEQSSIKWLIGSLLVYFMAFFFKESAITFLAIFPLTMWFFGSITLSKNLKTAVLYIIPAILFLMIRSKVLGAQSGKEVTSVLDNFIVEAPNQLAKWASAFMMCGRYLWTLIMPHPLVSDLGFPQTKYVTFGDWKAILGFISYVGAFIWALMNVGKKHFAAFAILFFLITFSLYCNIFIEIGTSYGERLMYVPSLGFAFGVAWLLCKIFKISHEASQNFWNPAGKGTALWGTTAIVALLFGAKTIARNPVWYDSYALYAADIVNAPNAAKLNYHLALEYSKKGLSEKTGELENKEMVEKAVATYTKALELYPQYHDAYGSRGLAQFRLKNYDKAYEDYQIALKYRPNDAKVLSNMGFIYFLRAQQNNNANNDLGKAEEVYRKSVQYDPRFVDARRNLGAVFAMTKRFPEAIEQWKAALEIEPNNITLLQYMGTGYRDMGQAEKGLPYLEKMKSLQGIK